MRAPRSFLTFFLLSLPVLISCAPQGYGFLPSELSSAISIPEYGAPTNQPSPYLEYLLPSPGRYDTVPQPTPTPNTYGSNSPPTAQGSYVSNPPPSSPAPYFSHPSPAPSYVPSPVEYGGPTPSPATPTIPMLSIATYGNTETCSGLTATKTRTKIHTKTVTVTVGSYAQPPEYAQPTSYTQPSSYAPPPSTYGEDTENGYTAQPSSYASDESDGGGNGEGEGVSANGEDGVGGGNVGASEDGLGGLLKGVLGV